MSTTSNDTIRRDALTTEIGARKDDARARADEAILEAQALLTAGRYERAGSMLREAADAAAHLQALNALLNSANTGTWARQTDPVNASQRPPTIPVPVAKGGYHFDGVSSGEGPCVCCGRDVHKPGCWVVMVNGGGSLARPEDEAWWREHDDGDYMGAQPVGSDCMKLIPPEYRVK